MGTAISANELMLGNWVKYAKNKLWLPEIIGKPVQVDIDVLINIACHENERHYEPIPLSAEILEKCGFEKHEDGNMWIWEDPKDTKDSELVPVYAMHEVFYLRRYLLPDNQFCFAYNNYRSYPFKYVHQLQNCFYILTGQPLTIEL